MLRSTFIACTALLFATTAASPAALKTLTSFCTTGGDQCTDGRFPRSPLVSDASGTFYGNTQSGGAYGGGTIFALVPNADRSVWTRKVLRNFCPNHPNCSGGALPVGRMVIDTQGNIYGVTTFGGHDAEEPFPGHGVVFKLTPDRTLTVLYRFCVEHKCADGDLPEAGLTYAGQAAGAPYDGVSPLYGTTSQGGAQYSKGSVFEITFSGDVATRKTIYSFCAQQSCTDGWEPMNNLTVDSSGNIIGTASVGGAHESGVIFKLAPAGGGAWNYTVLHSFCAETGCSDGGHPQSGVLIDGTGAMFGLADSGRPDKRVSGTLYRLNGTQYSVLHTFCQKAKCKDGAEPYGDLTMDTAGNLFGTTVLGGVNGKKKGGTVFRYGSDGSFDLLYSFCANRKCKDGGHPLAGVVSDPSGKLFGTTLVGGVNGISGAGGGTVFELEP